MSEKRKKILLATDGSDQALEAVRYVAGFFPPTKTEVVLFHVDPQVPESLLDVGRSPEAVGLDLPFDTWALRARQQVEGSMDKGREILRSAGFPQEGLTLTIRPRQTGIARDILKEARMGYDAVVVGRSGVSSVEGVVVGSVPDKLVVRANPIPIAVVGGRPEPKKVLIGFDGSRGSMRAVDCACSVMSGDEREVTLCLVVRSLGAHLGGGAIFKAEHEKAWMETRTKEMASAFGEAENRLLDAGFHPSHIFLRSLENHASRAAGIKAASEQGGCGTIVLGKRGLSCVEEFPMGRVTRKVLQVADQMAVWVV